MKDPITGEWKPISVYLSVNQVDARALGVISGTFIELMSSYLIANPPKFVNKTDGQMGPFPCLFVLDEFPQMPKLNAIIDILRARMAKRGIPLRCLELGKVEPATKGTVRQTLNILEGIPKEKAKAIIAAVKATKLKVTAQMQDDQVRISGAKKDDLQAVIQTLKAGDFGVDLQFINMR